MRRHLRLYHGHWLLPVAILAALLAVMLAGDQAALALRYERGAVLAGEAWRLVTGHLVHADGWHLLWNVLGLALVFALFGGEYSRGEWLAVMLASTAAIDLGFLAFEPQIAWYVGLSGVIHGLLAAGLVASFRTRRDPLVVGIALLLAGKLVWEHLRGPLPFTAGSIGVPVIHEAHTYGAIGGVLCALALLARRPRPLPPL